MTHAFRLLAASAVLLLIGCAAPVAHKTASGRAETTISGVSAEAVKASLTNELINKGYRVTSDTPSQISFDRPVEDFMAAALIGSRYDAVPNARVTFNFVPAGRDSVRVVSDMAIITNPGSAFERRMDMNRSKDSEGMQSLLDWTKTLLEPGTKAPGAI